ncbi:MAG: hypothetical protein M1812_007733 [Candelaria pacifica]|nr:MAG: hypothetical protein M1812_007733 [Candelaria pacifica]
MADGFFFEVNDARALRVAELMNDYRNLQHYITQCRANPTMDDYYEQGYAVLRQCEGEAQAILLTSFADSGPQSTSGNLEQEKAQLQRILLDASSRRFQVQKIYLRAIAAVRWVNSRNAVLGGQRSQARHAPSLQAIDDGLQMELATITDERVLTDLASADYHAGRWIQEDPSLQSIAMWLRSQQ